MSKLFKNIFICSALVWLSLCMWACSEQEQKFIPDVSQIPAPKVNFMRLEQSLKQLDSNQIAASWAKVQADEPKIAHIFTNYIIANSQVADSMLNLRAFITFKETRELIDSIQLLYPDMRENEAATSRMLQFKSYYLPQDTVKYEHFFTYLSLYAYGGFVYEDVIGVGLDFYLGENHPYYLTIENLRHAYVRRRLDKKHIQASIGQAVANDIVQRYTQVAGGKLIDQMIYNGKVFLLMDLLQPELHDSLKYNFGSTQLEYCLKGEEQLYDFLVKEKVLYSDRQNDYRRYITESAFNPEINLYNQSANWLGMQIVSQYIERQRKKSNLPHNSQNDSQLLIKALQQTNPQEFLKNYKPTRR
jgi:hypothetical protein